MKKTVRFLVSILLACGAWSNVQEARAQDSYSDLDSTWSVSPSADKIAVQFDTSKVQPQQSQFFARHESLDAGVDVIYLHRGFLVYGVASGYSFSAAASDLLSDSVVHRAIPVYSADADSAEFKVTDLIDVQFTDDLSSDSCLAILAQYGLHFVDSSEYKHNLWECALDDTIIGSPLGLGNSLHVLDETVWACARQYAKIEPQSDPVDHYFANQWYLKNTGQNNGTPNSDIDADLAWQIPIIDSSYYVAILDDGFDSHLDFPSQRLATGYDYAENDFTPSGLVLILLTPGYRV